MLDNFSSALQLAMSYLKPRLATWKSLHPCWVPSRYAWHGPRRRQQRCNNCCNNEGRRWLEDGRIFVVLKIWWGIPTKTCFCWWNGSQQNKDLYLNLRWSRCGVRCGWKQVDERSTRKVHDWFRDLACGSITTWLLHAIDIDWSYCIGNIGYIGRWFEWSSALLCWDWLLITRLDALGFTFLLLFFGRQKCISTTCDPCTVWREILTVTLLRSDFVVAERPLGGFRPQSHGVTKTEWLELVVMLTQAIAASQFFGINSIKDRQIHSDMCSIPVSCYMPWQSPSPFGLKFLDR